MSLSHTLSFGGWRELELTVFGAGADVGMELNMAMFTRAGRSGYVLKPELLRRKGGEKDKESLGRTANFLLDLEVRSLLCSGSRWAAN